MAFGVGALPPGQIKMACRRVYPRRSRGRACVCFGTALVHCWRTTLSASRDCWSVLESMETRFRWSIAGLFSCPVVTSGPLLCFKERRLINAWRSSLRRSREIGECISNIIIIKGQQSAAFNSAIFTACVFIVNDSTSFYLEFWKIFWANSVFLIYFIKRRSICQKKFIGRPNGRTEINLWTHRLLFEMSWIIKDSCFNIYQLLAT